jgi:aldose 1-epimerase
VASPPSGAQHEIRFGSQRAIVCEVGGTLRSYQDRGVDLLDGFGADESSPDGRGQVLAPWPNRLDSGRYTFEGREGRAALDEPALGNAIHGLVRWLPWVSSSDQEHHVTMSCDLFPQPGYPWHLQLRVGYSLGPAGLTVETTASNASDTAAPFGIGFHPYFCVGTLQVDDAWLTIPSRRALVSNDRGVPVGDVAVEGSTVDFTARRSIGSMVLDTCFTELQRDDDGFATATLKGPVGTLDVWLGPGFGYLMAFTGDTLRKTKRRRSIALEPMTCPPNALRSGTDVIRLEPDASWSGTWGVKVVPARDGAG